MYPIYAGGRDSCRGLAFGGARPGGDGRYGNNDDNRISGGGVTDRATFVSRLSSVVILGQVQGTLAGGDHYGFVSEVVGSLKVGFAVIPLTAGAHNDRNLNIGATGDLSVYEV